MRGGVLRDGLVFILTLLFLALAFIVVAGIGTVGMFIGVVAAGLPLGMTAPVYVIASLIVLLLVGAIGVSIVAPLLRRPVSGVHRARRQDRR
jgi:hypothetical protein